MPQYLHTHNCGWRSWVENCFPEQHHSASLQFCNKESGCQKISDQFVHLFLYSLQSITQALKFLMLSFSILKIRDKLFSVVGFDPENTYASGGWASVRGVN